MVYINNLKETFLDFPDDESLAVIVFFEGCSHDCPGCQNPELQKRNKENRMAWDEAYDLIKKKCEDSNTNKIVFSGGDPFYYRNKKNLIDMFKLISSLESDDYSICVYTGSTIDQVNDLYEEFGVDEISFPLDINKNTNLETRYIMPSYIKCGVYNKNLLNINPGKSDDLFVLASSNQDFYKKDNTYSNTYTRISSGGILGFL